MFIILISLIILIIMDYVNDLYIIICWARYFIEIWVIGITSVTYFMFLVYIASFITSSMDSND